LKTHGLIGIDYMSGAIRPRIAVSLKMVAADSNGRLAMEVLV
jgi:hypothetical protein